MCFNNWKANNNKLTKQFKNFLSSHHILFSDYMLYLNPKADLFKTTKGSRIFNIKLIYALQEVTHTRMRAVASCPVSRSLAISRRICLSWISLRFLSSFIRGIVNLSSVLLYTKAQITIIILNKGWSSLSKTEILKSQIAQRKQWRTKFNEK